MNSSSKARSVKHHLISVALIAFLQIGSGCYVSRITTQDIDSEFKDELADPTYRSYEVGNRTISYIEAGDKKNPRVIFLHGAPGSSASFLSLLKDSTLVSSAHLLAVDRPGYGYSGYGKSVPFLEEQARMLMPLLKDTSQPVILTGHSFGGPVAVRLTMDYPELVDGLVLIAPAIDPALEPAEDWFRLPLSATSLRWLLPPAWRTANDEIYFLEDQLIEMLPRWKEIKIPVTVIQGMKDIRVPAGNARFAKAMLIDSPNVNIIIREHLNHFIPWQEPELIEEAIIEILQVLSQRYAESGDAE